MRPAPASRPDRVDPDGAAYPEYPAVEAGAGMELIERFERFLRCHLGKIVRVGRVPGKRMGEAPQARPDGS